ncbi:hypothetical protein PTTG_01075 [Puccinia triticina 1-1 BBBD Race 1]|uniref:Alpha-galactosidase n=1 Tax=Puccinia triticina (isolate 1-1 / race 1 (BBBD)) TaxID=630390 RepID=A0A180GY67_PUCT1|nr:hypothetical protein PTTG_01075 [Puccinia triticina 1-1 BBBD Race 1]
MVQRSIAEPNGIKPPMGWSSDWAIECNAPRDETIYGQADRIDKNGLKTAGYTTIIFDCGWERGYNSDGSPQTLTDREILELNKRFIHKQTEKASFPNGIGNFVGWIKPKGFNFGVGTWGGPQLCSRPFGGGPEAGLDIPWDLEAYVKSLADQGVVYLMHRPCDMPSTEFLQNPDTATKLDERYINMQNALLNTRVSMFYATGQWGASALAQQKLANSWRVSDEQLPIWDSFVRSLNGVVAFAHYARPGAFNDLGFLRLARTDDGELNFVEKRTMFTFWAATKSPLIFSDKVQDVDKDTVEMIKNPNAIKVNQDELGKSVTLRRRYPNEKDIWSGPLKDGGTVVFVVNWAQGDQRTTIKLDDLGFSAARVEDLWVGQDLGIKEKSFEIDIAHRGSLLLKLTETKEAPRKEFTRFTIDQAEVVAPAEIKMVGDQKVARYIGPEGKGSVVWKDIPGGGTDEVTIALDYIHAALPENNEDTGNLSFKRVLITVNDDANLQFQVHLPRTGMTWSDIYNGFLASIKLPNKSNTVRISGLDQWAPEFVALSIVKTPATPAT